VIRNWVPTRDQTESNGAPRLPHELCCADVTGEVTSPAGPGMDSGEVKANSIFHNSRAAKKASAEIHSDMVLGTARTLEGLPTAMIGGRPTLRSSPGNGHLQLEDDWFTFRSFGRGRIRARAGRPATGGA
jgi:hypothetical protein